MTRPLLLDVELLVIGLIDSSSWLPITRLESSGIERLIAVIEFLATTEEDETMDVELDDDDDDDETTLDEFDRLDAFFSRL